MMLVLKSLTLCRTSNKCHPAGERLFYVQRMSADSDYNVFTTISYDATNGTVTARAARDVSNTRWQAPLKPAASQNKSVLPPM